MRIQISDEAESVAAYRAVLGSGIGCAYAVQVDIPDYPQFDAVLEAIESDDDGNVVLLFRPIEEGDLSDGELLPYYPHQIAYLMYY